MSDPCPTCGVTFCAVDGCRRPAMTRSYCQAHYAQLRRLGTHEGVRPYAAQRGLTCRNDGCERPARTRGLCAAHYVSWKRTGRL